MLSVPSSQCLNQARVQLQIVMNMHSYLFALLVGFVSTFALAKGKCTGSCAVPTLVYDDLRCVPKYNSPDDCCAKEYDCSHIYNKPPGTCHLQGKFYKPGEALDSSIRSDRCDHASCECAEGGLFRCRVPSDSCAEFWVPDFVKPGCYSTHELNRCCRSGEECPPFDGIAKCEVNGVTYMEGQQFNHPTQKCTKCICDKNFNEKIEGPFCRQRNCTTDLLYSKQIQDHCAPYYRDLETCCPNPWICPSESGIYLPAPQPSANNDLKCKFGDKTMGVGEKYEQQDKLRGNISCECLIPPYLTCTTVR